MALQPRASLSVLIRESLEKAVALPCRKGSSEHGTGRKKICFRAAFSFVLIALMQSWHFKPPQKGRWLESKQLTWHEEGVGNI